MESFELDGVNFVQDTRSGADRSSSSGNDFVLVKTAKFLDFYDRLKAHEPKQIMEIGMFEGGSLVYFDKIFQPDTLVGLDVRREPIAALEDYAATRPYIHTYYGRFQEKEGTLQAARQNFPDGIDLVVDDASHRYAQTKATFQMLFPMVRAGGHYVIEDWAWSHTPANQKSTGAEAELPAMTNLIFELTVMASQSGVIDSIEINRQLISIRKGPGMLSPDAFDFSNCLRGKTLVQI